MSTMKRCLKGKCMSQGQKRRSRWRLKNAKDSRMKSDRSSVWFWEKLHLLAIEGAGSSNVGDKDVEVAKGTLKGRREAAVSLLVVKRGEIRGERLRVRITWRSKRNGKSEASFGEPS
jgi:hypothetical protein